MSNFPSMDWSEIRTLLRIRDINEDNINPRMASRRDLNRIAFSTDDVQKIVKFLIDEEMIEQFGVKFPGFEITERGKAKLERWESV